MRKRQVGVAATLARRRGKVVPVRVLNPSARKWFVAIGEVMAVYQAVEVLEDPACSKGRAVRTRDGPSPWAPELEDLYERGKEELGDGDSDQLHGLLEEYSGHLRVRRETSWPDQPGASTLSTLGSVALSGSHQDGHPWGKSP